MSHITHTKEYPLDNRKVVIFDDVMNKQSAIQKNIFCHYTDGKQQNINPIYLSQSYDCPSKIRHNTNHLALYPPSTKSY